MKRGNQIDIERPGGFERHLLPVALLSALLTVFIVLAASETTPAPPPELAAAVAAPVADRQPESTDGGIEYDSPEAALAALRATPGIKFREGAGVILAIDNAYGTTWLFTTPARTAHPAVAKLSVTRRDGAGVVDLQLLCGGTRAGCDAFGRVSRAYKERLVDIVAEADLALDGEGLPVQGK